jgi:hypothetical protein
MKKKTEGKNDANLLPAFQENNAKLLKIDNLAFNLVRLKGLEPSRQ